MSDTSSDRYDLLDRLVQEVADRYRRGERPSLQEYIERYPDLGKQLYNEQGSLRSFVNVYVGDEDIRYLQGLETDVPDGETVSIIPAIAGGVGPRARMV